MRSLVVLGATAALVVSPPAHGQTAAPPDAAAAREELKRGFALRMKDQCADAIPHLTESIRLDPQIKALLNLADCEERVGRLVDAEGHWREARELARTQGKSAMTQEATDRLDVLERRIPHLTIVLAPGAPDASRVTRDGGDVRAGSLGTRLPVDPGHHVVEVSLPGRETSVVQTTVAERDDLRLEVAPGPDREPPASSAAPAAAPTLTPPAETSGSPPLLTPAPVQPVGPAEPAHAPRGPVGYAGIALGAVGLVGIGVGAVEALLSQQRDDDALTACQGHCSAPAPQQLLSQARDEANAATVAFVAGGAVAAVGIALFVIDVVRASKSPARRAAYGNGAPLVLTW